MEGGFKQCKVKIVAQLPWQCSALGGQSPWLLTLPRSPGLLLQTISLPISSCHFPHSPSSPFPWSSSCSARHFICCLSHAADTVLSTTATAHVCVCEYTLLPSSGVVKVAHQMCAHTHTHTSPDKTNVYDGDTSDTFLFSWVLEVAECQSAYCNIWVCTAAGGRQSILNMGQRWFLFMAPFYWSQCVKCAVFVKKKKRTGCHRICYPKWKWISKYHSMLRLLSKNTQISRTAESFIINYPGPYKWMLNTKQMFCMKTEKNTLKFSTLAAAKYSLWSNFLFAVKITKAKQKRQTNPIFFIKFFESLCNYLIRKCLFTFHLY